jgi:lipoprotein NlpD
LICALGLCGLVLAGCADTAGVDRDVYVVQPQDTLYSIAWRHHLDFHDLARWNHIGPDFRISVGQRLLLVPSAAAGAPRKVMPAAPRSPATPSAPAPVPRAVTALKWMWPTEPLSAPQPVPSGGILLAGREGQDIRAACAGRVVYAGSGLRGYGNLIILKHGENLLSAYAHNRESLVQDGQEVALGQVIAHMGVGVPDKPVLYFEIRRDGKPVDAEAYLPRIK